MTSDCVNYLYQNSVLVAAGRNLRNTVEYRFTPGHGYLEALVEDNAEVVTEEIVEIKANGLVTKDGKLYEVDTIVCATGFNTSFTPPFKLIGTQLSELI